MCGIAGVFAPGGVADAETRAIVAAMTAALQHRGPDDSGQWVDPAAGIAFGHRLSDEGDEFTASTAGLSQSLSWQAGDSNWGELGAGASWQAPSSLRFSAEATAHTGDTAEPDASVTLGASYRLYY